MIQYLRQHFHLEFYRTTWKRELMAGITSFFTSAYIILVNPLILKDAGIPLSVSIIATIVTSIVGCLLMALWVNAPIIVIPGMGINAFFSYSMIQSMGLTPHQGLAVVIVSGILFFLVSISSFGGRILASVPNSLKHGITVGIGFYLTFIGLQKGGIIQSSETTIVTLGNFGNPVVISTLAGLVITLVLFARNITGSLLIGLFFTSLLTLGMTNKKEITGDGINVQAYSHIFASGEFSILQIPFWIAVFSMTMIVLFENMGLLSGMLPDIKKFPRAYKAVALSTVASGIFGTSPAIASAESASGISEGGKTGIPALVTAILFALSAIALPFIQLIPGNAVAPVLIIIGALMMKSVLHIPFHEFSEGFPAFLIIVCIPLTSSIADGLAFGFIVYPMVKIALGKSKQVSFLVYLIAVLFLLNIVASSVLVH
ncbi:NCS2 family permease [Alteribacillus bidgolensis]|uniref:Putative MFS transporter, AGZA family, xanthine/uracil permease n=1 Tax=Alteribacillus bidgolensis TaxID=930129 RepID=A0A1G8H7F8_9BACI|nr:NCS2 family permease [Alteribacillus bidgolensis]SDI02566.1 putative MFS transporter, AGZA family, xanthine/uracil permease [Alteribacillus bidgolensis]